jgi:hypothetical protein
MFKKHLFRRSGRDGASSERRGYSSPGDRPLCSRLTAAANTVKHEGMALDRPDSCLCRERIQLVICLQGEIDHTAAVLADKVTVVGGVIVVMLCAAFAVNLSNLPQFCEQVQIAVDGAEADAGVLLSEIPINHIRRRVIQTGGQIFQDGIPLSTVLPYFHRCLQQ